MKKLIFILLVFTSPIFAQEGIKTITVIGKTEKQIQIGSYHLTISLHQITPDGYQQSESKSLAQIKQAYSNKLKAVGVNFSTFKENKPLYAYMSHNESNDVVYYSYSTTSSFEIRKVIAQKMSGMRIYNVEVIAKEKTNDELVNLASKAIINAKVTAQKIADKLNKKIGAIMKIENSNTADQYLDYYKPNKPQKHYITVTFTLE
jgi:hypothetical protein